MHNDIITDDTINLIRSRLPFSFVYVFTYLRLMKKYWLSVPIINIMSLISSIYILISKNYIILHYNLDLYNFLTFFAFLSLFKVVTLPQTYIYLFEPDHTRLCTLFSIFMNYFSTLVFIIFSIANMFNNYWYIYLIMIILTSYTRLYLLFIDRYIIYKELDLVNEEFILNHRTSIINILLDLANNESYLRPTEWMTNERYVQEHQLILYNVIDRLNFINNNDNNDNGLDHLEVIFNENYETKSCSICLDDYNTEDTIIKLECNHIFHKQCIINWKNYNSVCPNCRNHIN